MAHSAGTDIPHTTQDLWNKLERHDDRIQRMAESQIATAQRLNAIHEETDRRLGHLERAVEDGFDRMQKAVQGAVNEARTPKQLELGVPVVVSIAVFGLALFSLFGGFTMLITTPLKETMVSNRGEIEAVERDVLSIKRELDDRAFTFGELSKAAQWHEEWLSFLEKQNTDISHRLTEAEKDTSELRGRVERNEDIISDIDNNGSRKWSGRPVGPGND